MSGIIQNGNFSKIMFLLIALFFGGIIVYQMYNNRGEHVDELLTALLVFFTLTGRTITEAYKTAIDRVRGEKIEEN